MTYLELRNNIASWMQRSDLSTVIPTCVQFATAAFSRVLRVPDMEATDTDVMTSEFFEVPDDFLEAISVRRDSDGKELRYIARPQFQSVISARPSADVQVYTIEDWQVRVYPAPTVSEPLSITLTYYERLQSLVGDTDTNWLLTEHPDLYMYGSLIHMRAWVHDEPRLREVKALHDEAMAQLLRKKVHATGIVSGIGSEVPVMGRPFSIHTGY